MSNEIIVISTTKALTESVKFALNERNLSYPVYESLMDDALSIVEQSIKKGTKVVISRGGTSDFLRSKLDIPVVDIRHGFIDIYISVKNAKKISDKIAIIGFKNICDASKQYCEIMRDEINILEITEYSNIDEKVKDAIRKGIKVVVGGIKVGEIAEKNGINFVTCGADKGSINQAINEAQHDLKIAIEQEKQEKIAQTIINHISEGVLSIDKNGEIIYINKIAREVIDIDNQDFKNDLSIFPILMDTIETGNEYIGKLISKGKQTLIMNSVPILIDEKSTGVVATIQSEDYIQSVDVELRKKYIKRGHYAKFYFDDIIGFSKIMELTKDKARKYSKTNSTILILGETGTGKEIFAQSIHNSSERRNNPFVAINCASLPENILESELFGYVRGAFTGARNEGKAGIFEMAHTGTVFLDEIGELSLNVQVKMLRVLQEREITRIGDDKIIPVDIRILAATNKNLALEVRKGLFREDLYYRLCVMELKIPPLRERKSDIPSLALHFLNSKGNKLRYSFSEIGLNYLMSYDWPGNIRQLFNFVERIQVISNSEIIDDKLIKELLNDQIDFKEDNHNFDEINKLDIFDNMGDENGLLKQTEKHLISLTLTRFNGNKVKSATVLGINPTTLWRKMKEYDIK